MKRAFCFIVSLLTLIEMTAQTQDIDIWQGTPVHLSRKVTLRPYLPERNLFQGAAVIVCPGGSYSWHAYKTEGTEVAEWLQGQGIAAFVLKYRVQGYIPFLTHSRAVFGGHQHPNMLEDMQRAIQWLRENADSLGIDSRRIGAMGFSAGGHLAMSAACYATTDFLRPLGIHHAVSLRPDFVAPIYPVVSMTHPCTHKRSRRALLGEWGKFKQTLRDSLSLERHIPADCPPVFLVSCADDPVVKIQNSDLLDAALTEQGIPHVYIRYNTGGHGFGVSETKGTAESRGWKAAFTAWLQQLLTP